MTLSKHSTIFRLTVITLSIIASGCSSSYSEKKTENKLEIERSIIASPVGENRARLDSTIDDEKKTLPTEQSTSKIANIAGFNPLEQAAKTPPIFTNSDKVTISVDGMSAVEFIHYVFNDLLAINYVISSQVEANNKKISLNITEEISKEALYKASEELLESNDIGMLRKDNIIYFQKKEKDKRYTNTTVGIGRLQSDIPESTGTIVQVIPYIYTNSRNIASIVKKLTGIEVKIDARLKVITAEGGRNDIVEVMRVLQMLDVPSSANKEIRLIELAYIAPDILVSKLTELLNNDGYQVGKDNDITFVAMPRLGGIVVYGVSLDAVERVELWTKKLDIAIAGNEPQFYIYRPLFNKAVDLQSSLGGVINSILVDSGVSQTTAPLVNGPEGGGATATAKNVAATSSMSVDPIQNALVFYTTADKYRKVLQLLEKIDQLPGQVILDIAIAEVTLVDSVSTGINWVYDSNGQAQSDGGGADGVVAGLLGSGSLNIAAIKGDWRTAINLIASKSDLRLLSKPFLIVKDGESASINAGDSIPTLTQSSTSDTDRVTNSVQYVTTGIQVTVTPTINAKGLINLAVTMSSSSSNAASSEGLTPTITNKSLTTNIFSSDGQTVALGGLINESLSDNKNHVPFLGAIPIIGELFRSSNDDYKRTELIMLITTRIVQDITEVDEFKDKILDLYSFPLAKPKE